MTGDAAATRSPHALTTSLITTLADRTVDESIPRPTRPERRSALSASVGGVEATPDAPAYLYFKGGTTERRPLPGARPTTSSRSGRPASSPRRPARGPGRDRRHDAGRVGLADLAIICAGGATTTVYPTTIAEDVAYILTDSGSEVVFAENADQVAKLRGAQRDPRGATRHRAHRRGQRGRLGHHDRRARRSGPRVAGRPPTSSTRASTSSAPRASPSSSTPPARPAGPRACELVQDSVVYEGAGHRGDGHPDPGRPAVPVAAAVARLRQDAGRHRVCRSASRPPSTGASRRSSTTWPIIKPTFMAGPPRIFEKAHGRVALTFAQETGLKKKLIDWALKVGGEMRDVLARRRAAPSGLAAQARASPTSWSSRRCRSASAGGSAS